MKMASEGTASTLVLVAAILQLVFFLFGIFEIVMMLPLIMLAIELLGIFGLMIFGFTIILYLGMSIFGIIFFILWFVWRKSPSKHKTGLIVTGILGIILAGVLPGLLALIGGAIAKKSA
jgi:hypothetical protein